MPELRTPSGHSLQLPEGPVSVGADLANEVPVAGHFGLAPVHFRLQPWEGGHFIEDAASGLGTLVNGHPVNWKPLIHGDVITAGELEVIYDRAERGETLVLPPPAAPLPPPPGLPPVTVVPQAAGIPPLAVMPLTPLAAVPPLPASILSAAPPAWLPEDLLPEGYRPFSASKEPDLNSSTPEPVPTSDTFEGNSPAASDKSNKRSPGRFLLPLAAALALLGWAGHEAWQRGHLERLLGSLRGTGGALPSPQIPASSGTGGSSPAPKTPPLSADQQASDPLTH